MGSFKLPKNETLQLIDIEFDSATGVVYAGQELKGRVVIMFQEEMVAPLRSARVRIIGRSRTSWPDDRYYQLPVEDRVIEHAMCHAEELFFDTTLTLYGPSPYEPESKCQRREGMHYGAYEFPFRYEIPNSCPTTYEGEYGYIRYVCCASVSTVQRHDQRAKRAFTVIQPCDLNSFRVAGHGSVDEPVAKEASVTLRSGCCLSRKANEITMIVTLPKSGYVCGEQIAIWANIVNNSSQKVKKVKATLLQRIRYKSKYRSNLTRERVEYRTISQVCTKEELGPRWALVWDQESIRIPALPPTIDGMSDLVQVDYGLVYEAATINLALPIHIGTIPLKSAAKLLHEGYKTDFSTLSPNRRPSDLLPHPPHWKRYDGKIPPPCYCKDGETGPATIRERADNEYAPGQLEYDPRYPYYGWPPEEFSLAVDSDNLSMSVFQ